MNATAPQLHISFGKLASVYGCSRQRLHQLSVKHGRAILLDPVALASKFTMPDKPLVKTLADEVSRERIARELATLQNQ